MHTHASLLGVRVLEGTWRHRSVGVAALPHKPVSAREQLAVSCLQPPAAVGCAAPKMLLVVREHTSPSATYGAVLTLCSCAAIAAAFCAETARAQQLAGEVGGAKQAERVSCSNAVALIHHATVC